MINPQLIIINNNKIEEIYLLTLYDEEIYKYIIQI